MEKFLGNVDELVRGGKLNISLEERQRRICLLFTDEHIRQIISYYHASMDKRRIRGTIPSKKETMTMDRRSGGDEWLFIAIENISEPRWINETRPTPFCPSVDHWISKGGV